jgi:hypothetical protein
MAVKALLPDIGTSTAMDGFLSTNHAEKTNDET